MITDPRSPKEVRKMTYSHVRTGIFRARPNRFIAIVDVDGADTVCHVKNTGRCKELLVPGCTVILAAGDNPARKTPYDVIAVYKGERLINMDSQAPNAVAAAYLRERFPRAVIRREVTYGDSRLDFAVEDGDDRWFVEVKGCTLEVDNVGYFPDAPTQASAPPDAGSAGGVSRRGAVHHPDGGDRRHPSQRHHPSRLWRGAATGRCGGGGNMGGGLLCDPRFPRPSTPCSRGTVSAYKTEISFFRHLRLQLAIAHVIIAPKA